MTSTYGERLYASLYSQTFQNADPRVWSLSYDEITEALDVLAAKARDYATKPTRETMIEQFRLAFPGEQGNWLPGMGAEQEYVTWLYDVAWDIATTHEQADDEPADVQTSGLPTYPTVPSSFETLHGDTMKAVREWAENGVSDVQSGVDLMANYLRERGAWMTDSCATTAEAKDFLGNVMRYKTALLAASEPEAPTSDDLPRRFTIVRDSISPNVRAAAPVGTLVELVKEYWNGENNLVSFRVVGPDGQPIRGGGAGDCWWIPMSRLEEKFWREPQIGEFYTVVGDNPVDSGYSHGDIVVIEKPTDTSIGKPRWEVRRAGDPVGMYLHREHMSMEPVQTSGQTVGEVIDAAVQPLEDEVGRLKVQLEQVESNYNAAVANHRADIRTIERHFWEQAWRRGWCSEAEDVINDINQEVSIPLENDRDVYKPEEDFEIPVVVELSREDRSGLEWTARVRLDMEATGRDRDDAVSKLDEETIRLALEGTYDSTPRDYSVDDWRIDY